MNLHYKVLEIICNPVEFNPQNPDTDTEISLPTKGNQGFLGKKPDFRNKARNIQDNLSHLGPEIERKPCLLLGEKPKGFGNSKEWKM